MNNQHIFFDTVKLDCLGPSLVDETTNFLDIYIDDGTYSTTCELIGKNFEWKPLLWMYHERQRLNQLDKMRVITCQGVLTNKIKNEITKALNIPVEFIGLLLGGHSKNIIWDEAKIIAENKYEISRTKNTYYSVGTMRLPRFVITAWLQQHKQRVGRPSLHPNHLKMFRHQISRTTDYDTINYDNSELRLYGNVTQNEFRQKQIVDLLSHRIGIASSVPWYDVIESFIDEKFTDLVACKCVPFFVGNGDENKHIAKLGFESYIGFDYSGLSKSNHVERWLTLLNDNKDFLLKEEHSNKIYEMNKDIIEYNYKVLINTNWYDKANTEFKTISSSMRQTISKLTSGSNK